MGFRRDHITKILAHLVAWRQVEGRSGSLPVGCIRRDCQAGRREVLSVMFVTEFRFCQTILHLPVQSRTDSLY